MDTLINDRKSVEEYKSKITNQNNPQEIQKMAERSIIELKKLAKNKKTHPDISSIFIKMVLLLEKDPISGLALMDHLGDHFSDFLSDEKTGAL